MPTITPINAGLLFAIAPIGIFWCADRTTLASSLEFSNNSHVQLERDRDHWRDRAMLAERQLQEAGITVQ